MHVNILESQGAASRTVNATPWTLLDAALFPSMINASFDHGVSLAADQNLIVALDEGKHVAG